MTPVPLQSGKLLGSRVRQRWTKPRLSRSPTISTLMSDVRAGEIGSGAAAARLEAAKATIGSAKAIPQSEIEAIIAFVPLVMELVVTGRYQPLACPAMNHGLGKDLPAHVVGD